MAPHEASECGAPNLPGKQRSPGRTGIAGRREQVSAVWLGTEPAVRQPVGWEGGANLCWLESWWCAHD
eukprot:8435160-Pyramimonas_sp.AAC.1